MIKVKDRNELKEIIRERYKESLYNNKYTIDVGDIDVSNVKYMYDMFRFCKELKEIRDWEIGTSLMLKI